MSAKFHYGRQRPVSTTPDLVNGHTELPARLPIAPLCVQACASVWFSKVATLLLTRLGLMEPEEKSRSLNFEALEEEAANSISHE
ncbi:hypothetical protein ACTXT7_016703 [Hymenolepis weldensis]